MAKPTLSDTKHLTFGAGAARLIAIGGSRVGCKYVVTDTVTIGRSGECEVVVDNAEVSRRHAVITRGEDGFVVEDQGSRNGTIVNGARTEGRHKLSFGDKVRVGPQDVFLFTPHDPVEEQILHRQRLETLGRLTAGVAHDLNNMIGAVTASVAYIRRLPDDARSGEDVENCLDDIDTAATRAADLAGRLLSFARSSGSRSLANISEIVHEGVMLARRTFDRTIAIKSTVAENLHVEGDSTQLHQVLMNLLVNARDAMTNGKGEISVELEGDAKTVVIRVRDNGCGMDEDTAGQIFEPFYTTKRPGTGFGLGLATVSDIITSHAGTVSVQSTVNEGTTFTIQMPGVAGPTSRQGKATLDAVGVLDRDAKGMRIALVDDEPVMRRSLARVLRRAGFDVMTKQSGEEMLAAVDDPGVKLPEVMVLDLDLPGMTGEETLRKIRKKLMGLQVVCISGHHDTARQREVLARGAAAFLGKPFEPSKLVAAVFEAIENRGEFDDTTET